MSNISSADTMRNLDIAGECFSSSSQMVESAMGRHRYGAAAMDLRHDRNDDDPPIGPNEEEWKDQPPDFERLLGLYRSSEKKIVLFNRGITWLAGERTWHREWLEKIVDLHEYAHAAHHLGSMKHIAHRDEGEEARYWKNKDIVFVDTSDDLLEQIAQIGTLLAIRTRQTKVQYPESRVFFEKLEGMFFDLMRSQSPRYRLPDFVREMQSDRLQQKLKLLLQMSDRKVFPLLDEVHGILA